MIRNQWYAVLQSREVKKRRITGVTRMGEKLVFWRDENNEVGCIADLCCHRKVSLSTGTIQDGHVRCPFHGFEYDHTGKVVMIPAIGKNTPVEERFRVDAYPVREEHGMIWIWWGEKREEYPPIRFFDNLEGMQESTFIDPWKSHYSRAIENQLDVIHVPIVHHNTIGRGNRTLIHGPLLHHVKSDAFQIRVYLQHDDGKTKVLKTNELPEWVEKKEQHLHFIFPNLWQNYITEKMRLVVFFAPVDNENTLFYLRVYQKAVKIPPFNWIFFGLMRAFSRVVAHQDRRVVETQRPYPSAYKSDEVLLHGDHPVVHYRKRRDELQKQI